MSQDSVMGAGPVSSFLVLSQTVTNSMVAYGWMWVDRSLKGSSQRAVTGGSSGDVERRNGLNYRLLLITSFCYFAAMASSNEALRWVSYPAAVLAKSSKLIPTMVMGFLVERRSYSASEWVGAALITSGIIAFNWSRMAETTGQEEDRRTDSPYGLALLFFSLAFDGLLSSCQGMLKQNDNSTRGKGNKGNEEYRPPSAIETMLFVNLFACIFLLPASVWSGHFTNGVKLLTSQEPSDAGAATWILLLNCTAGAGQVFIFLTIYFFSPLMTTTITTTRKFFTILLSVRQFGHVFSNLQWFSILMVFGGLYLEIAAKLPKEQCSKNERHLDKKED